MAAKKTVVPSIDANVTAARMLGAWDVETQANRKENVGKLAALLAGVSDRDAAQKSTIRHGFILGYLMARLKVSEKDAESIIKEGRSKDAPKEHKDALSGALMSRLWSDALDQRYGKKESSGDKKLNFNAFVEAFFPGHGETLKKLSALDDAVLESIMADVAVLIEKKTAAAAAAKPARRRAA